MGINPTFHRFANLTFIKGRDPVVKGGKIVHLSTCQVNARRGQGVAIEDAEGLKEATGGFQNLYFRREYSKTSGKMEIGPELFNSLMAVVTKSKAVYEIRTIPEGEDYPAYDVFEARPKDGKPISVKLTCVFRQLGEKQDYRWIQEVVAIDFVMSKDMPKVRAPSKAKHSNLKLGSYEEQGDEPSPEAARDTGKGRLSVPGA